MPERVEATPLVVSEAPAVVQQLAHLTPEQIDERVAQIERAAEAHKRLVMAAVTMTKPYDWEDFGGTPYLTGNGALRLAAIGLRLSEPVFEEKWEGDDCFVECLVEATWDAVGQRQVALGTCSTLDKFFAGTDETSKTLYNQSLEAAGRNVRLAKRMMLGHVKKKAHQNAMSRAVSSVMGLKGIKWEDLETMAGFGRENAGARVKFSQGAKAKTPNGKKAPELATVMAIVDMALGSRTQVRATLQKAVAYAKFHKYTVEQDGYQIELLHWAVGPIPEWAQTPGITLFAPVVEVKEYQGNRQYIAHSGVELVEPEKEGGAE